MLFYLDPPYYGSEGDYGSNVFGRDDFSKIAGRLSSLAGRFILSINDCRPIRDIFAGFRTVEVPVNYSISGGAPKPVRELIIMDGKDPDSIINLPK
jgi:DNA adenine methylase